VAVGAGLVAVEADVDLQDLGGRALEGGGACVAKGRLSQGAAAPKRGEGLGPMALGQGLAMRRAGHTGRSC
jgi:hypothetical protein